MVCLFVSCKTDYQRLEENELRSGKRFDDFIEGLHLGMTRQEYFDQCLQKNHDGVFTNGLGNRVQYKIASGLKEINLLFEPDYHDEHIFQFDIQANYVAWSPWNAQLSSDNLVEDLKSICMQWYSGNDFLKVDGGGDRTAWVKVDGNRRVTIWASEDGLAKVMVRDLTVSHDQREE